MTRRVKAGTAINLAAPKRPSIPRVRSDGEMYDRPEPNPFTPEWARGYDDGIEGRDGKLGDLEVKAKPHRYWDGFKAGQADREELDRTGSSNA